MIPQHSLSNYFTQLKSLVVAIVSSQLFGHALKLINLNISGGFTVLSTFSLQTIHPVLFSFFRTVLTSLCLIPMCLVIDSGYQFQTVHNTKQSIYYESIQGEGQEVVVTESTSSFFSTIRNKCLGKIPTKKQFKLLVICGVCLMCNQVCYLLGLLWTSPVIAAVFQPAIAAFTCVLSILVKKEKFSILKCLGVLVAMSGAIAMMLITSLSGHKEKEENIGWMGIIGTLCLFGNTISYSFYLIFQKELLDMKVPPITITTYCFTTECVLLSLVSIPFYPHQNFKRITTMAWVGLLYAGLALGTVAYSLGSYAARLLSPTIVSVYSCVSPMFAALYMFVFLGHVPSPLVLIGVFLITTGVLMVIFARYREGKSKKMKLKKQLGNIQEVEDTTMP